MTQGGVGVVRPEIERSWHRSRMCGLDHGSPMAPPLCDGTAFDARLMAAAGPVLDGLSAMLADMRIAVALSDDKGRLLFRRCLDQDFDRSLEASQSEPGFVWSEEFCGTNATGTAAEERVPTWVVGEDHYLEALRHLACAATPVVHPVTGRLVAVVALASRLGDDNPLMLPSAIQAAQAIEDRLLAAATATERALLAEFVAARGLGRATLVVGSGLQLSTPAAAALDAGDRSVLLERATDVLATESGQRGREVEVSVERPDGLPPLLATVRRVEGGGMLVDLGPERHGWYGRPSPAAKTATGPRGELVGRSAAFARLRNRITAVAALPPTAGPVLVSGETGSGKLAVARAVAGPAADLVLIDAAQAPLAGEAALLREATACVDAGRTVIVRRVGLLSDDGVAALAQVVAAAEAAGTRLIATATLSAERPDPSYLAEFGIRIDVPPLREHPDDLPDLVAHLLRRRGSRRRLSPEAVQTLMRHHWPGNVRELDRLIGALAAAPGSEFATLMVADLPARYQRGHRSLRRIEQVERAAIVRALAEADGNKSRAADLLEIGRATLYRKMRQYGLGHAG